LLDRHEVLRTVVEFRDRLQSIWDETATAHETARARCELFCEQARWSNIQALRDFATRLKAYRAS